MRLAKHMTWTLMVGALLAWCFAVSKSPRGPVTPTAVHSSGTLLATVATPEESVEVEGTVVADDADIIVVGSPALSIVRRMLIHSGEHVKKGQALAVVEPRTNANAASPRFNAKAESIHAEQLSDQLGAALSEHQAALEKARATLDQVKKERDEQVGRAESELERALNGAPPEQVAEAQRALDGARAVRDKAKAMAERDKRALSEGWISRNQATASQGAFETSEAALQKAEEQISELQKRPSDVDARAAKGAFARVRQVWDDKVKTATEDLDRLLKGGLAFGGKSQAVLPDFVVPGRPGLIGKIARRMEVRSPVDGTVLKAMEPGLPYLFQVLKVGAKCMFVGQIDALLADRLRPGMQVRYSKGEFGEVLKVGPVDPRSGQVPVEMSCPTRTDVGAAEKATIVIRSTN